MKWDDLVVFNVDALCICFCKNMHKEQKKLSQCFRGGNGGCAPKELNPELGSTEVFP